MSRMGASRLSKSFAAPSGFIFGRHAGSSNRISSAKDLERFSDEIVLNSGAASANV
jgi:hypothetical protein